MTGWKPLTCHHITLYHHSTVMKAHCRGYQQVFHVIELQGSQNHSYSSFHHSYIRPGRALYPAESPSIDSPCSLLPRCYSDETAFSLISVISSDGVGPVHNRRGWERKPSYFQPPFPFALGCVLHHQLRAYLPRSEGFMNNACRRH